MYYNWKPTQGKVSERLWEALEKFYVELARIKASIKSLQPAFSAERLHPLPLPRFILLRGEASKNEWTIQKLSPWETSARKILQWCLLLPSNVRRSTACPSPFCLSLPPAPYPSCSRDHDMDAVKKKLCTFKAVQDFFRDLEAIPFPIEIIAEACPDRYFSNRVVYVLSPITGRARSILYYTILDYTILYYTILHYTIIY